MRRPLLVHFIVFLTIPLFAAAIETAAQDSNGSGNGNPKTGGLASAPVLIHEVTPKYPESARKAKVGGTVTVNLLVDVNGNPSHVRVIRGPGPGEAGMDLDESAIAAVRQYKFKPAMRDGKAVAAQVNLDVYFKIF